MLVYILRRLLQTALVLGITSLMVFGGLYLVGDPKTGAPSCASCHGPTGGGNPPASYPALRGQYATYVAAQLRAYRAGTRQTDPNQMMRNVAGTMSDEQIDAVATYVQGLR